MKGTLKFNNSEHGGGGGGGWGGREITRDQENTFRLQGVLSARQLSDLKPPSP